MRANAAALELSEHDDHQERMMGFVELQMRLEAVEPLDQLETPRQLDESAELLREHHPGGMALAVDVALAVLMRLELHVLIESLGHRVQILQRLEGGPDRGASPAPRPRPAARGIGPGRAHVAIEDVEAALANGPGHAAQMGEDGLIREQVTLRVLHADGRVHGPGEPEPGHVGDVEPHVQALLGRSLAQEHDVLGREVETRHAIAAAPEADQVRTRAARDVENRLDRTPGKPAEAVGEEIHLLLPIHVEGDLVVARRGVLGFLSHLPHHVRIASRRIQDAVMPVRPDGSKAWATSIRSVPTIRQGASSRTISTSSAAVMPQGSGAPVPGASDGSSTSTSMVT